MGFSGWAWWRVFEESICLANLISRHEYDTPFMRYQNSRIDEMGALSVLSHLGDRMVLCQRRFFKYFETSDKEYFRQNVRFLGFAWTYIAEEVNTPAINTEVANWSPDSLRKGKARSYLPAEKDLAGRGSYANCVNISVKCSERNSTGCWLEWQLMISWSFKTSQVHAGFQSY